MNQNVQKRFNTIAPEYEKTRRKFIPDFDNFYQSGVNILRCDKPDPRVLDLGAGTGLYTLKLLERYPRAKVTLVDFAPNMLEIAGQIFADNQNISFIQADYANYDFAGEKFDIVISALSIHHFDKEEKRKIYNKISSLLTPDGEFLNADQISADTEELDLRYRGIHAKFVKEHASQPEYEQFLENIKLDLRSPVFEQSDLLRAAGFAQVDCVFKLICFAVMYGQKNI